MAPENWWSLGQKWLIFASFHSYPFLLKLHNYFHLYLNGYGNREKETEMISSLYGRTGNMGAPLLLQWGLWTSLMGITLELLTNEIIRPQPKPNEKNQHFNKTLRQFIHILIFEKCSLRSPPFALRLPTLIMPESSPYGLGNLPTPGRLLPTRRKNG